MYRLQDMVRMHREGRGFRETARILGMSPNTERKYRDALQAAGLLEGESKDVPDLGILKHAVLQAMPVPKRPNQKRSRIAEYEEEIGLMLDEGGAPKAIYDALRLNHEGFSGSVGAVKRVVKRLRKAQGPRAADVVIRVETGPAEVAQVDYGYVGKLFDPETGRIRKAYIFVMVLGFSRLMYVDIVFSQDVASWIGSHIKAFEFFGGVPKVVVPDNLKAAVIKCYFEYSKKPGLQRSYQELARHYEFLVDPTLPYTPEHKGKVESGVKYVKNNFFKPRNFADETIESVRKQLMRWRDEIANVRTHGTTGKLPIEHYETREKQHMKSLPRERYQMVTWKQAKVHQDSHITFERRMYSVPFKHIGTQAFVRAQDNTVVIYVADERVATHPRKGSRFITIAAHLPTGREQLRNRSRHWWQERANALSPVVGDFVREIFESDQVVSQLRNVQAVVSYLEKFPVSRAESACERARLYGNYTYSGIKGILTQGLDLQPVLPAVYQLGSLENPRFARSMDELLDAAQGGGHELN